MTPSDINSALKNLGRLKKGDRIGKAASSDRMNAIQDILRALVRGDNVVTGPHILKKTHEGHFILSGEKGGRGGGGTSEETPFLVVPVSKAPTDTQSGDLIGVISNSHIFNSEDRDTYEEDNSNWGLLQDDIPASDPGAWRDHNYFGDKIWVQIELDEDQVIQSIDIMHGTVGQGQWDTFPNPIEINDDDPNNVYQQFYHQIIAEITDPDTDPRDGFVITNDAGTSVQVTQCLFTDLMMTTAHTTKDADYPDMSLLVAEPWRTLPTTDKNGEADEINDVPIPSDGGEPMTAWAYGPADPDETPFQVVSVRHQGDTMIGVISNSHLFNSEDKTIYEEDNSDWGLLSDDQTTGAFVCPDIGGKIWLEITLDADDQSISSIDLKWGQAWEGYPDPIDVNSDDPNNVYQQYYRQLIAEITDPEQDPRPGIMIDDGTTQKQVTQLLFGNLMMTTARTTRDADDPGLPLLVPVQLPWLPGTADDGSADEIPPDAQGLITPWQFAPKEDIWNFKLEDGSDDNGMKIEILDGMFNGVFPVGMGDDAFSVDITEWDPDDGEVDIVLTCEYDMDGNFAATNISIAAVKPENYPEDEPGHSISIGLGVAYVNPNGQRIDEIRNTFLGDIDVQLAPTEVYAFQMFDSSEANNAKIRIFDGDVIDQDGVGHTPQEMGDDEFEADGLTDGDSIYLQVTHDQEWNVTGVTVEWDQTVPDDTDTQSNIEIGYVEVFPPEGPDETVPQVIPHNTVCGDLEFLPPETFNRYAFEIIDRSDGDGPKVLILDGDVIDQDGEGHTPESMGSDSFIADGISDGDSFYVQITHDDQWNVTETPTIEWNPSVPDDTDTVSYIEFGYVGIEVVDGLEQVTMIHNTICGDIFFNPPPPDDVNFNFKLEDASDGSTPQVRVYTGNVFGPQEGDTDLISGLDGDNNTIFTAYDGMEVYIGIQWDQETDDGISGDNIVSMWITNGSTPDDSYLTQYVTLGDMAVSFDGNGNAFVDCQNSICGDIAIPYPPYLDSDQAAYLFRDVDTGDVVWKKSGIKVSSADLSGEDTDVEKVDAIRFEPADDPSAAYIEIVDEGIDVDGFHVATLRVPLIPESAGGFTVLVDDDGDTHWGDTDICDGSGP